ncbi:MAG: lyase family protein [Smithella sp.]
MDDKRIEYDFLGALEMPADVYWGIHTQRAIHNFPISGIKVNSRLIKSLRDLSKAIANLQGAFQEKEKESAAIVKLGRTELQEAVPITLGAEFSAFAELCFS